MKKTFANILTTTLSALTIFSAAGCHIDRKIVSNELSKGYTRNVTAQAETSEPFKQNLANFSFAVFHETLSNGERNDLFSPLSAALCLALINNGANGNTRAQLETLFGMETNELNRSLYAYTNSLYSGKNCTVNLANSIWFKEDALHLNPDFLQANADWYGAQAYASKFDASTVKDINNWCYNQTKGKIDKILDEIPPYAVMYLINALDFEAKWLNEYKASDVHDGVFHGYQGQDSEVSMLYSKESTYLLDDNAVGFAKSYIDGNYEFVALLPDEGVDVYDYAQSLTGEEWERLWAEESERKENGEYRDVYVRMPEFTYESELSLNECLQSLGVTDMFSPETADFSGMDNTQILYCDVVKQKTVIEHNRHGTKAAAITWGAMKGMSAAPAEPLYIYLERPFVYTIMDSENHLPLFLGVVSNL